MEDTTRYLFDVQGFVVLENVIGWPVVQRLRELMNELEAGSPDQLPHPVVQSKPRTDEELYLSNIVEAAREFEQLIDVEPVIDVIQEVSSGRFRLNHTYAIYHYKGGCTPLHMGGVPVHPKAHYLASGGRIFSSLTKVVFPIENHSAEDGCFAVIPGSHKACFPLPAQMSTGGLGNCPGLVPVEGRPGDAIVFTEALTHGSLPNVSGRCRKSLFYCYSVGYMPDWTKFELTFSQALYDRVTEPQREILRLKSD